MSETESRKQFIGNLELIEGDVTAFFESYEALQRNLADLIAFYGGVGTVAALDQIKTPATSNSIFRDEIVARFEAFPLSKPSDIVRRNELIGSYIYILGRCLEKAEFIAKAVLRKEKESKIGGTLTPLVNASIKILETLGAFDEVRRGVLRNSVFVVAGEEKEMMAKSEPIRKSSAKVIDFAIKLKEELDN